MEKRLRLEEAGKQAAARTPAPGTAVKIAIDLSRTKLVYCVRWAGQEQRRLSTPGDIKHVHALVSQYRAARCTWPTRRAGSATRSRGGRRSSRSARR